jgi:lysophospholipase L1-like esterase
MSISFKQLYSFPALAGATLTHNSGAAPTPTPTAFAAGTPTESSVPLSWAGTAGATFVVQRAANAGFSQGVVTLYTGANTSLTNNSGLSPATPYYYRVKEKGNGQSDSPWATLSVTTAADSVAPYVTSWAATVDAAGGSVSSANRTALSNLYTNLVAAGYWPKIRLLYLFLPGAIDSTFNFKDAATFRATFSGGLTSDGTGYYDTRFIPADHAPGVDNLAFDVFENFTSSGLAYSLGITDYSGQRQIGIYRAAVESNHANTLAYMSSSDSDATQQVAFLANAETMLTLQRSSGGVLCLYQYGRKVHEITSPVTELSGQGFSVYGMAKNTFGGPNSVMTGTHKHLVIREALADAEVEHLTHLLHAYHIETGRATKADVVAGDSITHALNVADGWFKRYTVKAGTMMQNWAVSGQIGQDFCALLADAQLPTYNATTHNRLLLAHGTNDVNNGESAATYAAVLSSLIGKAVAKGWPAGRIASIPAFYQRAESAGVIRQAYLASCQAVASSTGTTILNVYQAMKGRPNADADLFDASDGTHPNPTGAQFIADTVFDLAG